MSAKSSPGPTEGGFGVGPAGYIVDVDDVDDVDDDQHKSLIERLRGSGVGVEDPNIVGDVGPTDIPPGRDPETDGGLFADPPQPIDGDGPTHSVGSSDLPEP